MLQQLIEELFKPIDSSDLEARRNSGSSPFYGDTLWWKWVDGGYVGIVDVGRLQSKVAVCVLYIDEDGNEQLTDWPISYTTGKIAYNMPEFLTPQLRALVAEAFDRIENKNYV